MFVKPVDAFFDICTPFGEKNKRYNWSIDPDNGVWIPARDRYSMGQHCGIDFACPSGTIVRAIADGFIVRSRFENSLNTAIGSGLYISQLLMMPGYDNWSVKYSHLKASFVRPGDRVKQGQPIAESGKSGEVQFSYLHIDLLDLKYQWRDIPWS